MQSATLGLILVLIGVVLLAYGFMASDSLPSHLSRFFTGQPSDRTTWLTIGGGVVLILGVVLLVRSRRA